MLKITEVVAIIGCLIAVSSSLAAVIFFLLKSGYRLGERITRNADRVRVLEEKVEDLEGFLSQKGYKKRNAIRIRKIEDEELPEGLNI